MLRRSIGFKMLELQSFVIYLENDNTYIKQIQINIQTYTFSSNVLAVSLNSFMRILSSSLTIASGYTKGILSSRKMEKWVEGKCESKLLGSAHNCNFEMLYSILCIMLPLNEKSTRPIRRPMQSLRNSRINAWYSIVLNKKT